MLSVKSQASVPRLLWLLSVLIFVFAVLPSLGALVGLRGFGTPLVVAAIPMAIQFDLTQSLFHAALFGHSKPGQALPAFTCWIITVFLWAIISVALWALTRWFLSFRYRHI
jgi:hypothetical protein